MASKEIESIGVTYQGRPRTWGFRLSPLDIVVLIGSFVLTAVLWRPTSGYAFIALVVVLHFFLFCNVFRIPRNPELIWGCCFLGICATCLIVDVYSPMTVTVLVLPVSLAIIGWSCRLPSYHGVFADRINPRLNEYLAGRNV